MFLVPVGLSIFLGIMLGICAIFFIGGMLKMFCEDDFSDKETCKIDNNLTYNDNYYVTIRYVNGKVSNYDINTNNLENIVSKVISVADLVTIDYLGSHMSKEDYFDFDASGLKEENLFELTTISKKGSYRKTTLQGKELFRFAAIYFNFNQKIIIKRVEGDK